MGAYNKDILFIHIPKTAGAAVRAYLEASVPGMTSDGFPFGHIRMQDIERFTGRKPDSFQTIIAVIRDPYEQQLSQWRYLQDQYDRGSTHVLALAGAACSTLTAFLGDARAYMPAWYNLQEETTAASVTDEYLFWLALDGELPSNLEIIRHERLADELPGVVAPFAERLLPRIPKVNTSRGTFPASKYYTHLSAALVERNFQHTIPTWYTKLSVREPDKRDRSALLARLPKASRGVEVGVWKGDFSQEILDNVSPKELCLVDPWEKNDDKTNYESTVNTTQSELDAVHTGVVNRFADDTRVAIWRMRSDAAASAWQGLADWVYVDSIHTFTAVYSALAEWWPHVKPGGMACGDDCWRPDVAEAAKMFAEWVGGTIEIEEDQFIISKAA